MSMLRDTSLVEDLCSDEEGIPDFMLDGNPGVAPAINAGPVIRSVPVDRSTSASTVDTSPSADERLLGNGSVMDLSIPSGPALDESAPVIRIIAVDSPAASESPKMDLPSGSRDDEGGALSMTCTAPGDGRVKDSSAADNSADPANVIQPVSMSDVLATSPDFDALKALYMGTGGACWTKQRGWTSILSNTITSCRWTSIHLEEVNRVVAITMANNLTGSLPEQLQDLTCLRVLDLKDNSIGGSIPKALSKLRSLTHLDLSRNRYKGSLCATDSNAEGIFKLRNLKFLALSHNQFNGGIPAIMGKLVNLEHLDLTRNNFDSKIPKTLGKLTQLQILRSGGNKLKGDIPVEFAKLINLRELWLEENILSGTLPDIFGGMKNLKSLFLYKNQLGGKLPRSLANLEKLEWVHLEIEMRSSTNKFRKDPANRCVTMYEIKNKDHMRRFKAQLLECDSISTPLFSGTSSSAAAKHGREGDEGSEDHAFGKRQRLDKNDNTNEAAESVTSVKEERSGALENSSGREGHSSEGGGSSCPSTNQDILSTEIGMCMVSSDIFEEEDVIKYVTGLQKLRIVKKKALRAFRKQELVEELAEQIGVDKFHVPLFVQFWEDLSSNPP